MNIEPTTGGSPSDRKRSRLGRLARLTMLALPVTIALSSFTPAEALVPAPWHQSGGVAAGSHVLYATAPVQLVSTDSRQEDVVWGPELQYLSKSGGWVKFNVTPTLFIYNRYTGAYQATTSYWPNPIVMSVNGYGLYLNQGSCWRVGPQAAPLGATCNMPPVYAFANLPSGWTYRVVEAYVWGYLGTPMATYVGAMVGADGRTSWSF